MPRPILSAVGVLSLALLAAPAHAAAADPAAASKDLQCALVLAVMGAQATTPEMKQGAIGGVSYYLGRLKGREPDIDLPARVTAEAKAMQPADIQAAGTRCGAELKAFGAESQTVGAALKALGPKPPK
ncbi:MAG: hypothetical protein JF588_17505 [Caulobacterales bacterium]|nr:hypothetical protein [Caulobacterales bacterium]